MWLLLILAVILLFIAPFSIMGRIGSMEERLNKALNGFIEAEKRLEQLMTDLSLKIARLAESAPAPEAPLQQEAVASAPAAYEMPPDLDTVSIPVVQPIPPVEAERVQISAQTANAITADAKTANADEELVVFSSELLEKPVAAFEPREPGVLEQTFQKFWSWLLKEGNIWVCAGVTLFLIGFGLLFNYVIQRGFLSLEMRLAGGALTGIAMTWFGFQIRERRRAYGLILQGGGMGVLYLVVLAATLLKPILPPALATVAMLALSVFTVLLALLQNYQPLALFAILGGFAAPILVSTDSGNHVMLFSIYTLLNFEILALSFKRDWRLLSRLGFILTASIGTSWGVQNWSPELFSSVEPFLVTFLATYTLIALAPGSKIDDSGKTRSPDWLLAVSAPFAFFLLQMQVAGHFKYGMALTCLGLGLWHLVLGAWLRKVDGNEPDKANKANKERLALSRFYMFLCLLFSNLVIPYTFDNTLASAIWAIEGAFLVVAANRTGSYKALLGGIVLHAGALLLYGNELAGLNWNAPARLSPIFVSGTLFALSFLCSGFWTTRFRCSTDGPLFDKWEEAMQNSWGDGSWARDILPWVFTILGSLWWWGTINDQTPRLGVAWISVFSVSCLTALLGSWMSVNFNWKAARFLLVWPIASAFIGVVLPNIILLYRIPVGRMFLFPLGHLEFNAFIYLICVGGALYILRKAEKILSSPLTLFAAFSSGLHLAEEAVRLSWVRFGFNSNWALLISILPLLGLLFFLRQAQSTQKKEATFPIACATGVVLFNRSWRFLASFLAAGSSVRGSYIPFLNPLELWQVAILLSLVLWAQTFVLEGRSFMKLPKLAQWGVAALFFAWFNQIAVRASWHYWGGTSYYNIWDVFRTAHCQAVIAIFWGIMGLCAILYGQKTRSRDLWRAGAALLAADAIKLLLVDLYGAATFVRITAFLVLGGLFLLIGWVAPLPPKEERM